MRNTKWKQSFICTLRLRIGSTNIATATESLHLTRGPTWTRSEERQCLRSPSTWKSHWFGRNNSKRRGNCFPPSQTHTMEKWFATLPTNAVNWIEFWSQYFWSNVSNPLPFTSSFTIYTIIYQNGLQYIHFSGLVANLSLDGGTCGVEYKTRWKVIMERTIFEGTEYQRRYCLQKTKTTTFEDGGKKRTASTAQIIGVHVPAIQSIMSKFTCFGCERIWRTRTFLSMIWNTRKRWCEA